MRAQEILRGFGVRSAGVDLQAVAGGEDGHAFEALAAELGQELRQGFSRDGEALADLNARLPVAQAHQDEVSPGGQRAAALDVFEGLGGHGSQFINFSRSLELRTGAHAEDVVLAVVEAVLAVDPGLLLVAGAQGDHLGQVELRAGAEAQDAQVRGVEGLEGVARRPPR